MQTRNRIDFNLVGTRIDISTAFCQVENAGSHTGHYRRSHSHFYASGIRAGNVGRRGGHSSARRTKRRTTSALRMLPEPVKLERGPVGSSNDELWQEFERTPSERAACLHRIRWPCRHIERMSGCSSTIHTVRNSDNSRLYSFRRKRPLPSSHTGGWRSGSGEVGLRNWVRRRRTSSLLVRATNTR